MLKNEKEKATSERDKVMEEKSKQDSVTQRLMIELEHDYSLKYIAWDECLKLEQRLKLERERKMKQVRCLMKTLLRFSL